MNKFLKSFILLLFFFLLDITKPFGFYLYIEFLFLGIIFCALNIEFKYSILLAFIFGYIKSLSSLENVIISILEFPFITIFIYYFKNRLKYSFINFLLLSFLIFFHIIINNIYHFQAPYFSMSFFIQSIVIYYLFLENKKCSI